MLHQLLATICGITLQSQVNACRITLQQATIQYNAAVDVRLNKYKEVIVEPITNEYTMSAFALGKVVYDRKIDLHSGNLGLTLQRERFTCTWRLTF